MSYVTEMHVGGELRSLRFNNWCREALGMLYGTDPMDAIVKLSESWKESYLNTAVDIIYCGLVGDLRVRRAPINFTINDVALWMEDMEDAAMVPALKLFFKSQEDRILIKMPEKKADQESGQAEEPGAYPVEPVVEDGLKKK